MSEKRLKLLIVDDYDDNCDLLEDIFEGKFDTIAVNSGQACLDYLQAESVDLVLLDVNMPNMDGYEVCKRLKQQPSSALVPIIFVSALASAEERLKGFEVGADDYVTKPFKSLDIEQTVTKVLEHRKQTQALESQSQLAMSTAFQAMTNSAELGQIIQFMQASYNCKSTEQLSQCLFSALNDFGLNACVLFRMDYQTSTYGCRPDSIEAKVLDRFGKGGRILDFGARTLINDEHVSLLIKNMPLDKPENYGRIKDNLAALMSGTESRCKALNLENSLETERRRGLQTILVQSRSKLTEISELVTQQKKNADNVLTSINHKVEQIIFSLGLDESQEQAILATIDKGVDELTHLTHFSDLIESNFQAFIRELERLANH